MAKQPDPRFDPRAYTILRSGPQIVRDCWLTEDTTDTTKSILNIRQTRFEADGLGDHETKLIRLTEDEMKLIAKMIREDKGNG